MEKPCRTKGIPMEFGMALPITVAEKKVMQTKDAEGASRRIWRR